MNASCPNHSARQFILKHYLSKFRERFQRGFKGAEDENEILNYLSTIVDPMDSKRWEEQVAKFKTIATPPDFMSRFPDNHHPQRKLITAKVQEYYLERWAWASEIEKANYPKKDLEAFVLVVTGNSDLARTETAVMWCTWLFLFDDAAERMSIVEARQLLKRLTSIFSGERISGDVTPIEATAINFRRRILEDPDEAMGNFGDRVLRGALQVFLSSTCSKEARTKSLTEGFDAFMKYRMGDVAAWVTFGLLFWTCGVILPDDLEASDIYPLYYYASLQSAFVNDLYSYRVEASVLHDKDTAEHGHDFVIYSSITVLMAEKGISLEEAYAEVISKAHAMEDKYIQELEKLRLQYSRDGKDFSEVEKAAAIFEDLMGGNNSWSQFTGRYRLT